MVSLTHCSFLILSSLSLKCSHLGSNCLFQSGSWWFCVLFTRTITHFVFLILLTTEKERTERKKERRRNSLHSVWEMASAAWVQAKGTPWGEQTMRSIPSTPPQGAVCKALGSNGHLVPADALTAASQRSCRDMVRETDSPFLHFCIAFLNQGQEVMVRDFRNVLLPFAAVSAFQALRWDGVGLSEPALSVTCTTSSKEHNPAHPHVDIWSMWTTFWNSKDAWELFYLAENVQEDNASVWNYAT